MNCLGVCASECCKCPAMESTLERHDGEVIGTTWCLVSHDGLMLQISETHWLHSRFGPLFLTKCKECSFERILIGRGATQHSLDFCQPFRSDGHESFFDNLRPLLRRQEP